MTHRAWRALALLTGLTLGCGGPPTPRWDTGGAGPVTVPLVVAWHPIRPVVEARLGDAGPFLFIVDTATAGAQLSRPLATSLNLPAAGDPARGTQRVEATVRVGAATLRGVRFEVIDTAEFGRLDERPIAGVLGSHLWAGGALDLDPDRGTLTLWRTAPPPPAGGQTVPLTPRGDGTYTAPIALGDETRDALVATGHFISRIPPDEAEALSLPLRPRAHPAATWQTAIGLAGWRDPATLAPGPTLVGYQVLGAHPLRLDAPEARLTRWATDAAGEHLRRYPDLPDCGPAFARCLRGRVVRHRDRLHLELDRPQVTLPDRYWLRVNVGLPDHPLGLLVKLGSHDQPGDGPTLADARVPYLPAVMRPEGAAVDVVDVVPLAQHCPGEVCLR